MRSHRKLIYSHTALDIIAMHKEGLQISRKAGRFARNVEYPVNTVIDYLRGIRLVAGNGIRLNQHVNGITVESTATAGGGTPSGSAETGHPFDAKIVNKGTEENL